MRNAHIATFGVDFITMIISPLIQFIINTAKVDFYSLAISRNILTDQA
jgi:hypothetical protein